MELFTEDTLLAIKPIWGDARGRCFAHIPDQGGRTMPIDEVMQGRWCLLVEEEPYSTDSRTIIEFRGGRILGEDGVASPYYSNGNTIFAPLGEQVALTVNPGDGETGTTAPELANDAATVQARRNYVVRGWQRRYCRMCDADPPTRVTACVNS
jgi:hypothetical protein